MDIPKVTFRKMTLKENIDLVKWALFEKNDSLNIHNYTIELFPELASISFGENSFFMIEKVVENYYYKNEERIVESINIYNKIWSLYNDNYLKALQQLINIEWPKEIKNIDVSIGIIPVFPRDLSNHSFSMSIDLEDRKVIETCAHELLHFLWFKKWKQLYPKTSNKEYESPSLIWQYSEMVTDFILNDNIIKNIIKIDVKAYDSFYQLKHNNQLVMDHLRQIFCTKEPIENKIQDGYEYLLLTQKS